jgi:uncharacterized protein
VATLPRLTAYGGGRFRVGTVALSGSILILPDGPLPWPVSAMADITEGSLAPVRDAAGRVELLLVGCGPRLQPVPRAVRDYLAAGGIRVEPMDTGAACRTYNVLAGEDRRVAAALIAI